MAAAYVKSANAQHDDNQFEVEESAILKAYRLGSLNPSEWEDFGPEGNVDGAGQSSAFPDASGGSSTSRPGDEPDPLGLFKGGVLSSLPPQSTHPSIRPQILLHSKAFDPKTFLSTVHPNVNFKDLGVGRERLRDGLEGRSEALQVLVESEWDRFIGVKSATKDVFDEMRDESGPLADGSEYGIKETKEALRMASSKADSVFQPILDAQLKAERLRSTLGVFERSKFFFNLPGTLMEAIEAGQYDTALSSYKKGQYLLESRPGQLLGLPATSSPQQLAQHKRVFDKVWGQVEKIIGDLRTTLSKTLKDPKKGLGEVDKTIEILLELNPQDDPAWIFFDTQHAHILGLLKSCSATSLSKFKAAKQQSENEPFDEKACVVDLRACLEIESSSESVLELATGSNVWRLVHDYVKGLSEVIIQNLPAFWKVAKAYMDGKYRKKTTTGSKRSPAQCRTMTLDIVTLYVTLLSEFFGLNSSSSSPAVPRFNSDNPDDHIEPLPPYVPTKSSSLTCCHWLVKIMDELNECVGDINAVDLVGEPTELLKEMGESARDDFARVICAVWVRDAKLFYRLESWRRDPDTTDVTTTYLTLIWAFQQKCTKSAYRMAGGSEESTSSAGSSHSRQVRDQRLTPRIVPRIQTAFLDALYAFLDGLVQVAFSEPEILPPTKTRLVSALTFAHPGRQFEVKNQPPDQDTRILLTVSNLMHLRSTLIPKMINRFQVAFKTDIGSDVGTLMDVVNQLDGILFKDFISRKGQDLRLIIRKGVLEDGIDWLNAPRPTGVHPFIFEALLSLVLVHAQVSAVAVPLVSRTLEALVERLAEESLVAFGEVRSFGMGGMLQATLEIEFMQQTLQYFVTKTADSTLQSIYKTISSAFNRQSPGQGELQKELDALKKTLSANRKATMLEFLAFKKPARTE